MEVKKIEWSYVALFLILDEFLHLQFDPKFQPSDKEIQFVLRFESNSKLNKEMYVKTIWMWDIFFAL